MFVRTVEKHTLQATATAAAAMGVMTLLLAYPAAVATGISRGLSVCGSVIIPTLYPFMLLAGWLTDSPLCRRPGRWMRGATRTLFGLPGCCGPAILLSLVGGYPAGALAIGRLKEQGQITPAQVKRMTAFCVGGGPGFIISTVGAGLLGNVGAGVRLYIAHIAASLLIGLLTGRKERTAPSRPPLPLPSRRPIARMVGDTCASLLTMCGFVTLASTVLSLWEACGAGGPLSAPLAALLEVSCGCVALAGSDTLAPLWLSLCLSWGGLSVQGQLSAAIKGQRILTPYFWTWRLLHGILSGSMALLLFHFFPVSASAGNLNAPPLRPVSVSAAASFMLLLLCFLAMLSFCKKKTGKTE